MSYTERLLTHGNFLTRLAHGGRYRRTLELAGGIRGAVAARLRLRRRDDPPPGVRRWNRRERLWHRQRPSDARERHGEPSPESTAFASSIPRSSPDVVPAGSCDLAICTETLEHVPNPAAILDAVVRYCRPGACVVITVPIEVGPSLRREAAGTILCRDCDAPTATRGIACASSFPPRSSGTREASIPATPKDAVLTGHKGFDFRDVERALRERMQIEQDRLLAVPCPRPAAEQHRDVALPHARAAVLRAYAFPGVLSCNPMI